MEVAGKFILISLIYAYVYMSKKITEIYIYYVELLSSFPSQPDIFLITKSSVLGLSRFKTYIYFYTWKKKIVHMSVKA